MGVLVGCYWGRDGSYELSKRAEGIGWEGGRLDLQFGESKGGHRFTCMSHHDMPRDKERDLWHG